MAQPKNPPISIRPGAARLALIDAEAEKRGITRHAEILRRLDLGAAWTAPVVAEPKPISPAKKPVEAEKAVGFAVPVAGTFERKPYQKGQGRKR